MVQDGQEIAGYKLIKKVGEGGMGQVFLAEQIRLRRQVAIKLVHLDVKPEGGGAEPADELTREAEALMALEHPNILSLYDAGRSEDTAYLVMPYIPEGSLQDALRPGPRQQLQLPLAPGEALLYVEQAAAALQYAHDRNFVHRDVKPANFLIRTLSRTTSGGRNTKRLHLFLADFGLSKFLAYSSNTTHLSGTPTYMAPEQFQGHATTASDQYSLAILFFYLLTGDLPYRGSPVELMFHHISDAPPSPASRVEGVPESLASVIQRGMAKTPEERYPSVAAMAEAAREALIAAGLMVSQESLPAVGVVRPSDLQLPNSNPPASLGSTMMTPEPPTITPAATPEPSTITPAATVSTDDLATARGIVAESSPAAPEKPVDNSFNNMPTIAGKSDQGSLPTIAIADPKPPARPARDESQAPAGRRSRGMVVGLSVLAAVILIGAILGSGLLLQLGPFHKNAPVAVATQAPTATPTLQPTTTPTLSPTAIPASDLLNAILAPGPKETINLNNGNAPWDGPAPLIPDTGSQFNSPSGAIQVTNGIMTYNDHTFPTPLAMAVNVQAQNDHEFYIQLDTKDASNKTISYRLTIKNNAPPVAAYSTDNKTYTTVGTGSSTNTTWADGKTHTMILVLDGTRLVFYLDKTALVDATIPQPKPNATLVLATAQFAQISAIQRYTIPAGD